MCWSSYKNRIYVEIWKWENDKILGRSVLRDLHDS
jgi:hypothetical protein